MRYLVKARDWNGTFVTNKEAQLSTLLTKQKNSLKKLEGGANFSYCTLGGAVRRATGVTVYLENGGRLEHAQQMAAHESPRTTKLYGRTKDEITISEVERIQL